MSGIVLVVAAVTLLVILLAVARGRARSRWVIVIAALLIVGYFLEYGRFGRAWPGGPAISMDVQVLMVLAALICAATALTIAIVMAVRRKRPASHPARKPAGH